MGRDGLTLEVHVRPVRGWEWRGGQEPTRFPYGFGMGMTGEGSPSPCCPLDIEGEGIGPPFLTIGEIRVMQRRGRGDKNSSPLPEVNVTPMPERITHSPGRICGFKVKTGS